MSTDDYPPELQNALRRMSLRGPVVDMETGERVAVDGHLVEEQAAVELVACNECARAVALGWWGSISRHSRTDPAAPVCVLCSDGEAVHTAVQWFATTAQLIAQRTAQGQRSSWNDDALRGLGLTPPAQEQS